MHPKKNKRKNKVTYDVKVHLCNEGNGNYRLRFWHRHKKEYLRHLEKKIKCSNFEEALIRRNTEQADPRLVQYTERKNIDKNFVEFFEDIISTKRNKGTRTYYSQSLAKFKEFAGSEILFTAITKETIENFKTFLLRKVMQNTANGYFAAFAHIIRNAEEKGFLKHYYFKRISQVQVERDYLTKAEISKIIQTSYPNRLKEAFLLECLGAFGYNELKRLTWSNIDHENSCITSKRQKTGEIITNPIGILSMLGERGKPSDLVFPELTTLKKYNNHIQRLVTLAGINKHITSHCGRGSCIIHLIGGSGGTYSAKSFAGHRDLKTTLRYAKYTPELKKTAFDDLMQGIELPKTS